MAVFPRLLVLTLAAAVVVQWCSQDVETQGAACVAHTRYGDVQGLQRAGSCTYLGVPFAAPPIGNLRWRPPQPRAPWSPAVLSATVAPPACPQIVPAGTTAGNEDCLMLNIWTPSGATPSSALPVLFWIHAGAFLGASANFAPNDGRRFAEERNAVVVATNYRLGAFGWLAHAALSAEDPDYPSSGNYGLADQRAALAWVRDNIAAFGGDPALVTIAGSSAGSISAGLHLVSPDSRGLYQRAIMESGPVTVRLPSADEAEAQGDAFAVALGCTDRNSALTCLRGKTRDQILNALPLSTLPGGFQQFSQPPGRVVWGPLVDGLEIPAQPRELFRQGRFSRVPVIVGSNKDDGYVFVNRSFPAGIDALQYERSVRDEFGMDADAILRLYPASSFVSPKDALARVTSDVEFVCEARRVARARYREGSPVYVYSFEYAVDDVSPGRAVHGLEPNLVFGNNFAAPSNHVLTPTDLVVFDAMSTFWRRFMETGDPNPQGVPVQWPPYRAAAYDETVDPLRSDYYFSFGDHLGVSTFLRDQPCNFWEPFFLRTAVGAVPAAAR